MSEDFWFRGMLGIDVNAPPLPDRETRLEFIKRYADDSENAWLPFARGGTPGGRKRRRSSTYVAHAPG